MNDTCDNCGKPASTLSIEISPDGEKVEKHLCNDCAAGAGLMADVPISKILEEFVLQNTGGSDAPDLTCEVCGMSFSEFREHGLLGCPHDYDAFAPALVPLIEGTQEGTAQHVGKVPHRAGSDQKKQTALLRLRGQLKDAIAKEDYERAAALRDEIKDMMDS